jgi:hypothetical protein
MRGIMVPLLFLIGATACVEDIYGPGDYPPPPTGLSYELEPTGDPVRPRGILLRWSPVAGAAVYHVYSRAGSSGNFGLRGSTSSTSFHDDGLPHLEYFVTAESHSGAESDGSEVVTVDERLRLPAPSALTSISLDRRIHLGWTDNAYEADPVGFKHYRVYSASYDLDNNLCGLNWSLEGTTVAPVFLVGAMNNGVPRCFAVSAITIEGFESLWSPLRYDTPRPEARNLLLFTSAGDPLRSGFRFFLDANGDGQAGPLELGVVGAAGALMDFTVTSGAGGELLITPLRAATSLRLYSAFPIADLTTIDIAPAGGYARTSLVATPRFGYVFEMNEGDGFYRYGAIRVTALGPDYVIFDWSYQTDRGNPELIR